MNSRAAALALLLGIATINVLWMPAEIVAGDPNAWREETRSLLLSGELHVPRGTGEKSGARGQYFVENERTGLYYSKYGIANSLLAAPPLLLDLAAGRGIGQRGAHPGLLHTNLWNIALSVALAALLYALSGRYSSRIAVRALFVVAALYCTSLWFYLRAQSSEIYQTIFFAALFMSLLGFLRPLAERGPSGLDRRAWWCLAATWTCAGLLLFTRPLYGLLLPVIVLLAAYCGARSWKFAIPLLVPPALLVALLALVNHVKFGAPWLTGYHQWAGESNYPTGRIADGLWGFLFAPRFSVFLYFPLLIFALAGLRAFAARHRPDLRVMAALFVPLFLYLAMTPTWAGEWSYGPRYLLPMLPVLSLPSLAFADRLVERIGTWRARAWAACAVAVLGFSAHLQAQVNRLPFWTYYNVREALSGARSWESMEYLLNRHTGFVADDLLRHRHDLGALPYIRDLQRHAPREFTEEYLRNLGAMLDRGNLYWALPPNERR